MEERTVKSQNAYYKSVLFGLEEGLLKIPRPAHVVEKPTSWITLIFGNIWQHG
jgi:hypothetical protein